MVEGKGVQAGIQSVAKQALCPALMGLDQNGLLVMAKLADAVEPHKGNGYDGQEFFQAPKVCQVGVLQGKSTGF